MHTIHGLIAVKHTPVSPHRAISGIFEVCHLRLHPCDPSHTLLIASHIPFSPLARRHRTCMVDGSSEVSNNIGLVVRIISPTLLTSTPSRTIDIGTCNGFGFGLERVFHLYYTTTTRYHTYFPWKRLLNTAIISLLLSNMLFSVVVLFFVVFGALEYTIKGFYYDLCYDKRLPF